jgi:CDGSH-type Zn-finger protein
VELRLQINRDRRTSARPAPLAGDPGGDHPILRIRTMTEPTKIEKIEAIPDGPYLVHFTNGERVALCRCGASTRKPYCSGDHKARINQPPFEAPAAIVFLWPAGENPDKAIGGDPDNAADEEPAS